MGFAHSYIIRILEKHQFIQPDEAGELLDGVCAEADYFERERLLYESFCLSRTEESNAGILGSLAAELDVTVMDGCSHPDPELITDRISETQAERMRILPLCIGADDSVQAAVCYPWQEVHCELLSQNYGRRIEPRLTTPGHWKRLMEAAFGTRPSEVNDGNSPLDLENKDSVSGYIDWMVGDAIERGASDIHLEQTAVGGRVRYRLDGVLCVVDAPQKELSQAISARMKLLSGMNLGEKRLPQDGSMTFLHAGTNVDCRVSSIPSLHGECLAIRLLMDNSANRTLDDLGMDAGERQTIERVIQRSDGLFVVCGPTGAGKSTTLYAALRAMDPDRQKIITVEDPVESVVHGVNQVQINKMSGMTFASALRSILRQNPDSIMIGEIRDRETASIAVQAAFTGHAVFTSLHTKDALGAVIRMRDLGVESYLLSAAFRGAMSQRLVRKMIPEQRIPYTPDAGLRRALGEPDSRTADTVQKPIIFWKAGEEDQAYRGRTGIYEAFQADDTFLRLVHDGESRKRLALHLADTGFISMRENAWNKIVNGVTSAEEILAVLGFSSDDLFSTDP